jgi:hypothetical protein
MAGLAKLVDPGGHPPARLLSIRTGHHNQDQPGSGHELRQQLRESGTRMGRCLDQRQLEHGMRQQRASNATGHLQYDKGQCRARR